eukprot:TRINITY_DN65526_c0_g1_i1.p1 TRINITY_DN65526_c0_g1~~TRINITY_DN65526_c0_g1_i1.p1  ORF type:complete len:412 (+),score=50.13 TRINITY_DN65526_c0_g1_i1:88-1323(+)
MECVRSIPSFGRLQRTMSEDNILVDADQLREVSSSEPSDFSCETSNLDFFSPRSCHTLTPHEFIKPHISIVVPQMATSNDATDIWEDAGPAPEKKAAITAMALRGDRCEKRVRDFERVQDIIAKIVTHRENQREARTTRKDRKTKTAPSRVLQQVSANLHRKSLPFVPVIIEDKYSWPIIFFDWDDTLFPTWFVTEVVQPTLPKENKYAKLPADSPFVEQLSEVAQLVREVLVAASSAARVRIVTLARKPWVVDSSNSFLPGLDIEDLMSELGMQVHYAREYVSESAARAANDAEGVDVFMIAKRNAMAKAFTKIGRSHEYKCANVISVGDSIVEREASKELMWSYGHSENLCKTVKLIDDPSLDLLTMQLQILSSWLPQLVKYEDDLDISFDENSSMADIMEQMTHAGAK